MAKRKTICPNHGVIEDTEMDVMWMGGPPEPANYCPICGARTVVENPKRDTVTFYKTPSDEEQRIAKQKEIEHYRKIYWPDRKF